MKKCFVFLAALLLIAASFTFADMAASVYMTGSLYGTDGFILNNQNQKDADLLYFSFYGEKSGAEFKLWSDLSGDSSIVHLRSIKLWWKPMTMLNLSIGSVGGYGYTEQLDWWKTPTGASLAQASGWYQRWFNNTTGEAGGIQVDLTPMEGLSITGGVYPDFGKAFGKLDADAVPADDEFYDANTAYGIQVRYNITGFGSMLAAFKDNGFNDYKIARAGLDVNAVPNLYAFVTGIAFFDDSNAPVWAEGVEDGNMEMRGVAIDSYIKYTIDKLTLEGRFPLTLRITGDDGDDSFLTWRVRGKYALEGGISPYLNLETVDYTPLVFNDNMGDTFSVSIRPGMEISAEKLWADIGLQINVAQNVITPPKTKKERLITWSIPFQARVSF
jgi:hypothetical protein